MSWLAPAAGGAPISHYELSVRPALNSTEIAATNVVVTLSAYEVGLGEHRSTGSKWTTVHSMIPANERNEVTGKAPYTYFVPRLKCSGSYVLSVRGFNTFHGFGPTRLIAVEVPSCAPTTEPTFPPTRVGTKN